MSDKHKPNIPQGQRIGQDSRQPTKPSQQPYKEISNNRGGTVVVPSHKGYQPTSNPSTPIMPTNSNVKPPKGK